MDTPVFKLEKVVRARRESMEDFEGPLDLILYLLGKNKIEIQDLRVSLILDQYLEYLEERKELDMEIASDFVAMASHLLYIKTRMLLSEQDEEALSEMDELKRSLEERRSAERYEAVRAACLTMSRLEERGRSILVRKPEPLGKPIRYSHGKEELTASLAEVLRRSKGRLPPPVSSFEGIVGRETYPVSDKAAEIVKRLLSSGKTRFLSLFRSSRSRSEIVATFIAVLELCRTKAVRLAGAGADCTVERTAAAEDKPAWNF
ncbi:segregation and condensation protein A [Papillibacter cinnamivorans]|uniref:Segregation and condensation protein A n=1 Tax=Papillibacter cinnamivorans DSM 12816 TaxID=1122930 RepID=A0A1W1YUT4_9FIRM|nr:segregation/condensation protein A [Papillibacter cinnamivorans]SMC39862.1 condensin subunit ScpA [Papillibacter cinnamivorans DSM 12816]